MYQRIISKDTSLSGPSWMQYTKTRTQDQHKSPFGILNHNSKNDLLWSNITPIEMSVLDKITERKLNI